MCTLLHSLQPRIENLEKIRKKVMAVGLRLLSAVNKSVSADNAELTATQSDYVVILAALLCSLICAIGLAVAVRCFCLRHPILHTSEPPPGLNKKTLQLLPITKHSICESGGRSKHTDCAICLTEFADGNILRILPLCDHVFHLSCIDTWLGSHSSCPSCRKLVLAVGQCQHCGGFSAHRGFNGNATKARERELATLCRQDYMRSF